MFASKRFQYKHQRAAKLQVATTDYAGWFLSFSILGSSVPPVRSTKFFLIGKPFVSRSREKGVEPLDLDTTRELGL